MNIETILTTLSILGFGTIILIAFLVAYFVFSGKDFTFKNKQEEKPTTHWTDEFVSCEECKCLLNRFYAVEIDVVCLLDSLYPTSRKEYYCAKCKPNYTSRMDGRYFKELEVTEKGEPVGYKKDK